MHNNLNSMTMCLGYVPMWVCLNSTQDWMHYFNLKIYVFLEN